MFLWLTLVTAVIGGLMLVGYGSATGADVALELYLAGGAAALLIVAYLGSTRAFAHHEHRQRGMTLSLGLAASIMCALVYGLNTQVPLQSYLSSASLAAPENTAETGNGPKAVRIRRNPQGQYIARGGINHRDAEFLVDTGAAVVLLRQTDAEKAGIDLSALTFSVPIETANGTTYAAPVRIRSLSVGPIQIDGLEALVAAPGSLNESLLGISFLRRLRSYELAGDFMTLRE